VHRYEWTDEGVGVSDPNANPDWPELFQGRAWPV
jgi:hypothetical protein